VGSNPAPATNFSLSEILHESFRKASIEKGIMIVVHSKGVRPAARSANMAGLIEGINESQLRESVEKISVPRHFMAERRQNQAVANWLCDRFDRFGYRVERQGKFTNIVALPRESFPKMLLVGAHYDSVPGCPGADDNGSAVAALLGCAAACSRWHRPLPIIFAAFNCEEDGLLGSRDFVESYLPDAPLEVVCAHVLEMVGYAVMTPRSQMVPKGLPIKMSDVGDFLGLLANGISSKIMNTVLRHVEAYVPDLPVMGLNVKLGIEKYFPVLARSDHAPFWNRKIPAVMWTDTSEFRNRNYHQVTDTPDTLNYAFLASVTRLLTACVVTQAEELLEKQIQMRDA
jgi:hypothetical protein